MALRNTASEIIKAEEVGSLESSFTREAERYIFK